MRSIDIHAHMMPQCMWKTLDAGEDWYGVEYETDARDVLLVKGVRRDRLPTPKLRATAEERLADMDAEGTDVQVVSVACQIYGYHLDPERGLAAAREFNDEVAAMTRRWPDRFAGLANLPAQDVDAAIGELDRAVNELGLKGAELDTFVNGKSWDEPEFRPLFAAAEEMGAVLFYHPQPFNNLLVERTKRYGIPNSVGVTVEDALVVATLIFGGVLERCPDLKVCIAHGGGPACFGMGRLDHGWQVRSEARAHIHAPPSRYQDRLYYDSVTFSESALRFLIDRVGIDRVVLGSDYPFIGWDPSPGGWVRGLASLTDAEKEKILYRNLESLLGI